MRHRVVIWVVFLLMVLTACGGGGGGGGGGSSKGEETKTPVASAGSDQTVMEDALVTLDGSGSTGAEDGDAIVTYAWVQTAGTSVALSDAAAVQPTFTAPAVVSAGETLTFQLTVTDSGGHTDSDTCTITVNDKGKAEDALYAAYAGIGYGSASSTSDDEPLYDIMVDDLNGVAGQFVLNTIFYDSDVYLKLLAVLAGNPQTFTYTTSSGVVSSLIVEPGSTLNGYQYFEGSLSINFNDTGFAWNDCHYYGSDGAVDLTATITGYFKATVTGLEDLFLSSVTIQAQNTLDAVYSMGEVAYDEWTIAYQVYYGEDDPTYSSGDSIFPVNTQIVPTLISKPSSDADFRDYTLSGGFAIDSNAYAFTGMRYRQWQYDYPVSGSTSTVTRYPLALSGTLSTPDSTNIMISSPVEDLSSDPVGGNMIIRSTAGVWTSGLMNLVGISDDTLVARFASGTCYFADGTPEAWSVADWQDSLEP